MKTCSKCGQTKDPSAFNTRERRGRRELFARCKTCIAEVNRANRSGPKHAEKKAAYRIAKKGEIRRNLFEAHLRRQYGLTLEDFARKLESQGGACAICAATLALDGDQRRAEMACVDHCHATGKIRGLLCNDCNRGLGLFRDRPGLLVAATGYLKSFGL